MTKHNVLSDRTLPSFDNHYNNGVLIDNWKEDRIYTSTGRVFAIGSGNYIGPSNSVYKADFTTPPQSSVQPMMRRHGLGKELMFGTGEPTLFGGIATSTTYGASQRDLIDSKYSTRTGRICKSSTSMDPIPNRTFSGTLSTKVQTKPTADAEYYDSFSTTKRAMDFPVACYQFQRQTTHNEQS